MALFSNTAGADSIFYHTGSDIQSPHHTHGAHNANLRPRARAEPQGVLANANKSEIEEAKKLVKEIQRKMAVYRHARFSNPRRNLSHPDPGSVLTKRDAEGQADLALPVEFYP